MNAPSEFDFDDLFRPGANEDALLNPWRKMMQQRLFVTGALIKGGKAANLPNRSEAVNVLDTYWRLPREVQLSFFEEPVFSHAVNQLSRYTAGGGTPEEFDEAFALFASVLVSAYLSGEKKFPIERPL